MKTLHYILFFIICLQTLSFNLTAQCDQVTDVDGNVYLAVKIGNQCCMKENLKTAHFSDGSAVTEIENTDMWSSTNETHITAWCYFEGNKENDIIYGKLYNWYTVADPHNVCPAGWHVPSDTEFQALSDYLGGDLASGGHMKALTLWQSPNEGADNSSGFSALPGGYRMNSGHFSEIKRYGIFWSSTKDGDDNGWLWKLEFNHPDILRFSDHKEDGASVRCIKNQK